MEEFAKIEKSAYNVKLYNLLTELDGTIKKWKNEMQEKGYCNQQAERVYREDLMKTSHKASQIAYHIGDKELQDMLISFYITLRKLPSLSHDIKTVEEIEKAINKIMKHYEKKYKKQDEKLKTEIPGIFVVLLLSFLLFVFVSSSNFSSGYFVKSSELISISLIFSFLLAFSVILLLRNL
ncbi:MAG: hypothetical protein NZ942_02500 [Candidatus Aenigmarchaeota archaeon]|nr:hypothetical protein [Candidatus Aenigmarchaeota archaeon]